MKRLPRLVLGAAPLFVVLPASAQNQGWIQQLGTNTVDTSVAIRSDGAGGAFVGGTTGALLGGTHAGGVDAWLARRDGAGNPLWIRQLGTTSTDACRGVAPDGSGGVYAYGSTFGSLGGASAGNEDAWVARYDAAGTQLWIRQLGSTAADLGLDGAADGAGGVYLTGYTTGNLAAPNAGQSDVWIARYDGAGNQVWIRQLGTTLGETGEAIAIDGAGGAYVAGITLGVLGGTSFGQGDAWLARYDGAGNQVWIRQFGSSDYDSAYAVASDGAGGAYLTGDTWGDLAASNAGVTDAWIARYDGAGNSLWARQFGTSVSDVLGSVDLDPAGGAYAGGSTSGSLAAQNSGLGDVLIARYDAAGNALWLHQFGTGGSDLAAGVASEGANSLFACGGTAGGLGGPSAGGSDAWFARIDVSRALTTTYCTAKVNSLGCSPAIALPVAPSASAASGCMLSTSNVIGNKNGLYFHSTSGASGAPFHGGFLCVKSPTKRHAVQASGGTGGACNGSFSEDLNAYIASGADPALVAGAQLWIQTWSRDPGAAFTDSLSNAVTATICP